MTFFRSLGGTIGVSVLGAVLANRVTADITHQLAQAGAPATGGGTASNLNINALPEAFQHIVRAAYGDATGHIFLISAAIGIIGVVAALFLKPVTLRKSLDLAQPAAGDTPGAVADPDVTEKEQAPVR